MSVPLTPATLADEDRCADLLGQGGLDPEAAELAAGRMAAASSALQEAGVGRSEPVDAWFVPGRIEVLGKHTDYAGGSSLVAALGRGFCLAAAPRSGPDVELIEADSGRSLRFLPTPDLTPRRGSWSAFPLTVARRLARDLGGLEGGVIAFSSDLPSAAGLSSSSALIVATALGLAETSRLQERPAWRRNLPDALAFAAYMASVENGSEFGDFAGDEGVGTAGGSQDHTAILCARDGMLRRFAYDPPRLLGEVKVPGGYTFAIGVSGVHASKSRGARERYNRASRLAAAVTAAWNAATGRCDPHLAAAAASGPDAVARLKAAVAGQADLTRRLEHFLQEEGEIVPEGAQALAEGDLETFSRIAARSQHGAEELLGNQVPETSGLCGLALQAGADAASAFGAGFGGSVWALVERDRMPGFLEHWKQSYREAFPGPGRRSRFFASAPGPPAFRPGAGRVRDSWTPGGIPD